MPLSPDEELELIQLEEDEETSRDGKRGYKDSTPRVGAIGAGVRGVIDSMTLGNIDEIEGGFSHPVGAAKALMGRGSDDEDVKAYQGKRDEKRQIYARAKAEHPKMYLGGGVGGAVVGPGKIMSGLKGIKAYLAAMALGGGTGAGMSEAELADKEYGRLATDTGVGVATGAVAQKVSNVIGNRLSRAAKATAAQKTVETTIETGSPSASSETLTAARDAAKRVFQKPTAAPNAAEIEKAVGTLTGGKAKVPGYMLTRDEQTQNLASTVLKSPTVAGMLERRSMDPIREGIQSVGNEAAEKAGGLSVNEAGNQAKKGILETFKARVAPAEQFYDQVEDQFKNVPLNKVAWKRGINRLRKQHETDPFGGSETLIKQLDTSMGKIQDVAGLRKFRTSLFKYLDRKNMTDAEREIVEDVYSVVSRERNRSILNSSKELGRLRYGKGILKQLQEADGLYAKELGRTSEALGIQGTGRVSTRRVMEGYLKDTNPEQVFRDLFDRGNFDGLKKLQGAFPEQFDVLRKRALAEIIERSSENGILSPQRLASNLDPRKISPEVVDLIAGDLAPKIQAMRTTLGAMPRNFNPSDSGTKMEWLNLLNPKVQAHSLGLRKLLHSKTPTMDTMKAAQGQGTGAVSVIQRMKSTPAGQKYLAPLAEAAKKGEHGFAAQFFLMKQQDKDFRRALDEDEPSK